MTTGGTGGWMQWWTGQGRYTHPKREPPWLPASAPWRTSRSIRAQHHSCDTVSGQKLTICNFSPLQFLSKRPWQIRGGGTEEWWLHSMLWAGTNLVAPFSYQSSLRCTGHPITSSHVTWMQPPLRAVAPGRRDGAMCALREQIMLNPN